MHTTQRADAPVLVASDRGLPLRALLALAAAVFITSLTETLPAGVLPALSADLGVGESAAGQAVTVYAVGTALTAIPLSAATSAWRRKPLLLVAVAGFAAANTVTAISASFALTMGARFAAGIAAGVAWAMLAGYARGLVPARHQGKAIAIAMAGIPLALSLGVPAGTFLSDIVGWRVTFAGISAFAAGLIVWILAFVPDRPGQPHGGRASLARTFAIPGVAPVLLVTLVFVLAHTILFTYVASFLERFELGESVDLVLLIFGVASIASLWVVGVQIDRRLRGLMIASTAVFAVAAGVLAVFAGSPALVYLAAAAWGVGWGGAPTLLQTAVADAGGDAADTAQAMLVTLWNVAMAGGGVVGGVLLHLFGAGALAWGVVVLLVPVLAVVVAARAHGFPARRPGLEQ